ncbi:cytochrome P450 [Amycolatopsis sp. NPDC049868]|uniref:cytochrome P450 n=1 Tax=Amycolatopsis sp. NPDC049868 TaxID=3363934 RepID=UPI0037A8A40D
MKTDRAIPVARGAVPLLGHAWALARDPMRFLASLPKDADLVGLRLGPNPLVLICDPELTHQVLADDHTFDKGGPLVALVKPLVGNGLATCPRNRHRHPRRLLQPMFRPDRLDGYVTSMTAAIDAVLSDWRDGHELDIPAELRRLSIRVAVEALFSGALPPAVADRTADDFTAVLVGFAQRLARPPFFDMFPTPTNRHYRAALKHVRQTVRDTVESRRAGGTDEDDVLARLLTMEAGGEPVLDDSAILDHAMTFLIAPTATIASVLGWALHMLAEHPDMQDRLRAESDAVLAGKPADRSQLAKLELTRRVVTESLRMYPSLWFAPLRIVTTDTYLGRHHLPAGTVLAFSPWLVHHRSDLHENPERFDPDRWKDTELPAPSRNAFIPFGSGARQCIGMDFAFTEMVLALATITSRWRLEPVAGSPLPTRASVNLTARGLRLRTILRGPSDENRYLRYVQRADPTVRASARIRRPTRRKHWLI